MVNTIGYKREATSALYVPSDDDDFIESMGVGGAEMATVYGYPLPAMIACACIESAFGRSKIYQLTGCPFNLQKPSSWKYPDCTVRWLQTINKPDEKAKFSPFCVAEDLDDAARLWCEWIYFYPNGSAKKAIEAQVGQARQFAAELWRVGFAASSKTATKKFADLIDSKNLMRFA